MTDLDQQRNYHGKHYEGEAQDVEEGEGHKHPAGC